MVRVLPYQSMRKPFVHVRLPAGEEAHVCVCCGCVGKVLIASCCGGGIGKDLGIVREVGLGLFLGWVGQLGFYRWAHDCCEPGGGGLRRAGAEEVCEGHVEVGLWTGSGRKVGLGSGLVNAARFLFGDIGVRVKALARGSEARGGHAHLHSRFGHAIEGVATGFGGWAFFDHIVKNRGSGEDGEVY